MAGEPTLFTVLDARLDKFEAKLKQAGIIAAKQISSIETRFAKANFGGGRGGTTGDVFRGTFFGNAAFQAINKITDAAFDAVPAIARMADEAERVGLSTDAFQSLQFAMTQNGASADTAAQALSRFGDAIAEAANGTTPFGKLLKANSVALRDSNGNIRDSADLLVDFARLVANAGSAQEKLLLVSDAFGRRAGPAMIQTMEHIARVGLPGIIGQANAAGAVIGSQLVDKAREFDDHWDKAITNVKSYIGSWVTTLLWAGQMALKSGLFGGTPAGLPGGVMRLSGGDLAAGMAAQRGAPVSFPTGTTGTTIIPQRGGAGRKPTDIFESLKAEIELLKIEAETLAKSTFERERALKAQELLNAAKKADIPVTDALNKQIQASAEEYARWKTKIEEIENALRELNEWNSEFASGLSEAFKDATLRGKELTEVIQNLIDRLASKGIDKLFDLLFQVGQPGGGLLGSIFGAAFGGARQHGGPVSTGRLYTVGERGPELFSPRQSGTIIPNSVARRGGAAGSGPTSVNINMDLRGSNGSEELQRTAQTAVRQGLAQYDRRLLERVSYRQRVA